MSNRLCLPTEGVRLHQFVCGALPAAAYLLDWLPPLWVALALSGLALVSDRLALVARVYPRKWTADRADDAGPLPGLYRLDEGIRLLLVGVGLTALMLGRPIGWLPILAASATSILEGTTAFSFNLMLYTLWRMATRRFRDADAHAAGGEAVAGNPNCVVCQALATAPYGRCRWCRLSSVRWCCGLQTSMLLVLLLVIAFLLNAALEPVVTKLLVAMSIVGVVALSLAITRQTNDLIGSLTNLERARKRFQRRCAFLETLALADSVEEAAQAAVAHLADALGVQRVSVMVADDGHLRILACRGIPNEVAETVSVPVPSRICGRVFESGVPTVLDDVGAQPMFDTLGLDAGDAMASVPLVATAMKTAGRKIGVINVTDRLDGPFEEEDLSELQATAEAAAISLAGQLDHRELQRANYAAIRSLALAIEAKDPCTHGHSLRVQAWASAVAQHLGLGGERLQALTYAAELHDIGKLAIPDGVLKAPRRLTDSEWAIVQQHPRRGVEMVRHLDFLKPAQPAILHHHERLDGSGYPDGLVGDAIPLEARILAVIDAYDAMTSARPYRPPLSHEAAAAELRKHSGTQFDPQCVEAFLALVGKVPEPPQPAEAPAAETA
jgi:HD-GYP domain-containing protein (c-di-GMP phosphodiesterase class II)